MQVMPEIQAIVAVIAVIFAGAMPVMHYIRKFNSDKAANAKDSSEATLYGMLREQIANAENDLKRAREENNLLRETLKKLEERIARLELIESNLVIINKKLEEKDLELKQKNEIIRERDKKINELFDLVLKKQIEIDELQERIQILQKDLSNTTS